MRRILLIAASILAIFLLFRYCGFKKEDSLESNTNLLQQQIVNVGKLVVTEGHFAEVLTYKDQQKYLLNILSFEKKALLVVNTDVTVSYDLRQMKYDIDEKNKVITILSIPKEEITINPDIKFYDVEQSRLNAFTGDDYNKINKQVREKLAKKMEKSALKANAQNRLISELSKILILTNSMGWTLRYDGKNIGSETELQSGLEL